MNFPLLVFVTSLALTVLSTRLGDALRKREGVTKEDGRSDTAGLLLAAILTLLCLIIGFSFSMATNRYDLRKNCEQAEAIAIGTMYSRADLLAPADAAKVQTLLKRYLDQRMLFYATRSPGRASGITADTVRLQTELWSTLRPAIASVPPPDGLLVSGMNDVTNSQRSSQAAWLNRIPVAAWAMMAIISIGCCWLIGYRARGTDWLAFLVVPIAVSVCFFLIADLDSPRGGVIRVTPQNLSSLSQTLPAQ